MIEESLVENKGIFLWTSLPVAELFSDFMQFSRSRRLIEACIPKGEYHRRVVSVINGKRIDHTVWIPCFRNPATGKTFHPNAESILKPNSRYSLQFIGYVLTEYKTRKHHGLSVDDLCAVWGIAKSTLYRWKQIYPEPDVLLRLFRSALHSILENSTRMYMNAKDIMSFLDAYLPNRTDYSVLLL